MASDVQILITAQDKATEAINSVADRLDAMTANLDTTSAATMKMSDQMDKASGSLMNLGAGLGNIAKFAVNSVYFTAMGAAIQTMTDAVKEAVDTMIGFNAKQEQTAIGFETMIGSAAGAKTMIADLQKLADLSHYQYKDLTNAAGQLLAFGTAAKDIIPTLTTIGNVSAGLGLTADGMDHVVMALGKLSLESNASLKEVRELNSWHINAQKYLQQELGLTAEQIKHLKDAGVSGAQATKAIIDGMAKDPMFADMMEKQSKTMLGAWATFKDQLTTIFSAVGQVIEQPIATAIHNVTEKTTKLAAILRTTGAPGMLQADPGRKESEQATLRDTKEEPMISPQWQASLATAYNALDEFFGHVKTTFGALKTLISDAMGGANTFSTLIVVLTKVGSVAAITATMFLQIADALVKAAKEIASFVAANTTLSSVVVGITATVVAYSLATRAAAVATAAWTAIVNVAGPAMYVLKAAIQDYGVIQGIATAASWAFEAALVRVNAPLLAVAAAVGVVAAIIYQYNNGNKTLAVGLGVVAGALTLYATRAQIAAAATLVCSAATTVANGVMAAIRSTIIGAVTLWGLLNMALEGYNIKTVAAAVYTTVCDGVMAAINGTMALVAAAWDAITLAIAGFSLAQVAATAYTTVCDGVMAAITGTMALVAAAWDIVSAAVVGFSLAETVATVATEALDVAMAILESPILLVVAAIAAAIAIGYALYENWDTISAAGIELWNALVTTISGLLASFGNWVQSFCPGLYNTITGAFAAIANWVGSMWDDWLNKLSQAFSEFLQWILDKLGPIGEAIKGVGEAIGSALSSSWDTLTEKVSSGAGDLGEFFQKMVPIGVASDEGRQAINDHQPWQMDEDGAGAGKGKKGAKGAADHSAEKAARAYDQAQSQMERLSDELDQKLAATTGNKFDKELAGIQKNITKYRQEIEKATKAGYDTTDLQAKLDKYANEAPAKVREAWARAKQQFSIETDSMAAKAVEANPYSSADQIKDAIHKITQDTYDDTMSKLTDEQEKWRQAGMTAQQVTERTNAYIAQANAKRATDERAEQASYIKMLEDRGDYVELYNQLAINSTDHMRDLILAGQQDLAKEVVALWDKAHENIYEAIADASKSLYSSLSSSIADFIKGTKSAMDVVHSFTNAVLNSIEQIVAQKAASNIVGSLLGAFTGKTSSTPSSSYTFSAPSLLSGMLAGLGHRASGGDAEGWTVVGERGAELVNFNSQSHVYNAEQLNTLMRGGQSGSSNITVKLVNQSGEQLQSTSSSTSQDEFGNAVVTVVIDALNRNKSNIKQYVKGAVASA